jgi:phospholipase C
MFGHADMIWYSDANGKPAIPPNGTQVFTAPYNGAANPDAGVVNEVENPNPAPAPTTGTPRTVTATASTPASRRRTPPSRSPAAVPTRNCSDTTQPGVAPIVELPEVAAERRSIRTARRVTTIC